MKSQTWAEHNREVREVWRRYESGRPSRIPMILGLSSRFFIFNPETNPEGIGFLEYTENPDAMFEYQARFDRHKRMNIPADHEMGLPEDGWSVAVDFQNYFEAGWLGCRIVYIDGNVPASVPLLTDDNKYLPFDRGIPDAFSGLMGKGRDYYEHFLEMAGTFTLDGIKVSKIVPGFMYTDGPFTVACNLRGTTEFCCDLYEDPEYANKLLEYITDAAIYRIRRWRSYMGLPEMDECIGFADDSIALLSCEMYREFVLPCHKKLVSALSSNKKRNSIHLCGDATRHFRLMRDELNVGSFDTGFPIRHGELARELGPNIAICGGPHIDLLRTGTDREIENEVKRILDEVRQKTKKFILREANNVAPYTPLQNIAVMYAACKRYGLYD